MQDIIIDNITYSLSNRGFKLWAFNDSDEIVLGYQNLNDLYDPEYVAQIKDNYNKEFLQLHLSDFNYFAKSDEDWNNYFDSLPE